MNALYLQFAGTTLAGLTAAIHVFVGTHDTLPPLLDSDLDLAVKGTFQACWHFVSIFLVASVWCFGRETGCARNFAWLWLAFGSCFFAAGLVNAGLPGLVALPQWILLAPAGALILLSQRARAQTGNRTD